MAIIEEELSKDNHQTIERLRVKVFIYFADQWREKGIGWLGVMKIANDEKCFELYEDYYKVSSDEAILLPIYKLTVRSQQDAHERLISTYITNAIDYKVQEGSIVTWKEGDHEKALSFECAEDCDKFMTMVSNIHEEFEVLLNENTNGNCNSNNNSSIQPNSIINPANNSSTNPVNNPPISSQKNLDINSITNPANNSLPSSSNNNSNINSPNHDSNVNPATNSPDKPHPNSPNDNSLKISPNDPPLNIANNNSPNNTLTNSPTNPTNNSVENSPNNSPTNSIKNPAKSSNNNSPNKSNKNNSTNSINDNSNSVLMENDSNVDNTFNYHRNSPNSHIPLNNRIPLNNHLLLNNDDEEEETESNTQNETSSLWQDDSPLLSLPEICVENLDKWIQLLSTPTLNMSSVNNVFSNDVTNLMNSKDSSILEDSNQLYRYMSTCNVLEQFFQLFQRYENEETYELDILFKLHHIFRGFIAADNFDILRLMFEESNSTLLNVIGVLEYDPTVDVRVHHRDYLKNKAKFRKFFLLEASVTTDYPSTNNTSANNSTNNLSALSNEECIDEIQNEINADEINVDEINADEINAHKVNVDKVNADEINAHKVNVDKVNAHEIHAHKVNADEINADEINADDINVDKVNVDKVNADDDSDAAREEEKRSTLEQICEKSTLIYYIQYVIDNIMPTPSIFDDKLGPMITFLNHHKADLCNLIYDNTILLTNLFKFLTNGYKPTQVSSFANSSIVNIVNNSNIGDVKTNDLIRTTTSENLPTEQSESCIFDSIIGDSTRKVTSEQLIAEQSETSILNSSDDDLFKTLPSDSSNIEPCQILTPNSSINDTMRTTTTHPANIESSQISTNEDSGVRTDTRVDADAQNNGSRTNIEIDELNDDSHINTQRDEHTANIDDNISDYIDGVFFLHEFCLLSNSLNPTDKEFFFCWLESYNLLQVLTRLLQEPSLKIRAKVVDIIALLVDNKASTLRAFNKTQVEQALKSHPRKHVSTINMCIIDYIISTIIEFSDEPVSLHCINILNQLMDSDIMNNTDISYFERMEVFCTHFFTYSFKKFIRPLTTLIITSSTSDNNKVYCSEVDTRDNAVLMDKLLSLLNRWLVNHHDLITAIIVKENVIGYVTALLDSTHKFVVIGAIRLLRKLVDLKDEGINEELIKYESIVKLTDLFMRKYSNSNNLLNNIIVEMFNYILIEDIDIFYMPLVEKYRNLFNSIDYIDTFKRIVARHDANLNKLGEGGGVSLSLCTTTNSSTAVPTSNNLSELYNSVRKRKSFEFDNTEERWFESDDADERSIDNSSSEIDDALNLFLYGDEEIAHAAKKTKNSTITDEDLTTLSPSSNNDNNSTNVDADENLYDLLVECVRRNKNKETSSSNSSSVAEEEDVFDYLFMKSEPKMPIQIENKKKNVIKIHTSKFNSSRNLIVASNSKSNDEKSAVLTEGDSSLKLDYSDGDSDLKSTTSSSMCGNDSAIKLQDNNTLDFTNCLVETTYEDEDEEEEEEDEESDKSFLDDSDT